MTSTWPSSAAATTSPSDQSPNRPRAELGVIGGSGLYEFLEEFERVPVETPFGAPSDDVVVGRLRGRSVAFLARHGRGHRYPPHLVPYRANLWALRSIGVRQVLASSAVGSLKREVDAGTLVVPDQVVDRTWGRAHTVYDTVGPVVHVGFADPYCPRGRRVLATAARNAGARVEEGGTLVVVNGPRFSSRAESIWHQQAGWTIVGMTGMPEAAIARELAMCYTSVGLVTDLDAGVEGETGVTHREVLEAFARNVEGLKRLLADAVESMPAAEPDDTASCACRRALDGLALPFELPG